jgi:2-dehydro-3-deoxygluconokinase
MTRVLGIGECMIEMALQDDGRYVMGFAGDTFNTCWYLRQVARDALSVGYFSAIGDDDASVRMEEFMRLAGIDPVLAVRPGRTIGLYLISLRNGERSFSYWRSASAARTLADDLETLPGLGRGDVAYFSGITLAILPPAGRARLGAALTRARAEGVTVVFDPNIRPALWESRAEMRAQIMRAAGLANLVLPSCDDEVTHFEDSGPDAVALRYLDCGATAVVVKNGGKSLVVRSEHERIDFLPDPVSKIVDTTAAGDAFNAGFLASWLSGETSENSCGFGCRLAGQVITQHGALVRLTMDNE